MLKSKLGRQGKLHGGPNRLYGKVIEYYNKSSEEEFRSFDILKEQKLTQKCKKRLLRSGNYPEEVRNFFKTIPKKSYPFWAERSSSNVSGHLSF
jgi:hypothetical protein